MVAARHAPVAVPTHVQKTQDHVLLELNVLQIIVVVDIVATRKDRHPVVLYVTRMVIVKHVMQIIILIMVNVLLVHQVQQVHQDQKQVQHVYLNVMTIKKYLDQIVGRVLHVAPISIQYLVVLSVSIIAGATPTTNTSVENVENVLVRVVRIVIVPLIVVLQV
jgi:hypothetical protein